MLVPITGKWLPVSCLNTHNGVCLSVYHCIADASKSRSDRSFDSAGSKISAFQNGVKAKDIFAGISQPNVFFHLVTAYDILRKQGVPLGKLDYLSPFLPSPAQ